MPGHRRGGLLYVRRRLVLAFIVASLGTAVFLGVRALVVDLLEPPLYIGGCFLGAFVCCLWLAAPEARPFAGWLKRAVGICLTTYIFIGASHLVYRASTWDYTVPTEGTGMVLWAVLTTSWWLIPALAVTLQTVTGLIVRKGGNDGFGT